MTDKEYRNAIREEGKYIILVDDREILKTFDTPDAAHEYASAKVRHTKNNKIDIYITTGESITLISGIPCRHDIKPYQQHHIGINW